MSESILLYGDTNIGRNLNEEQRKAVEDIEGAVLVTAGAGTGKTRVLTHRIEHLIRYKGISPYHILAITFTNKAAQEMKDRLAIMLPSGVGAGVWASTFHSMCVSMLRKFAEIIGYAKTFSIYAEAEKERVIKKIVEDKNFGGEDKKALIKEICYVISSAKNDGLSPNEYFEQNDYKNNSEEIHTVYTAYEEELKKSNAFDFDDLLVKTLELLTCKINFTAREYYQEKFRYIHVDEFQDTNKIQYQLLKVLTAKHKNVMVVGDEDQSIYGWRGANVQNIRDYIQDFNPKKHNLYQNYRSTQEILDFANNVIDNNKNRIVDPKPLKAVKTSGDDVEYFCASNERAEAEWVVSKMSKLKKENYGYNDFAVLVRQHSITLSFEEKFIQYGIPYKITGGFKFYERKEIKDILAYLRLIANPCDKEAILRVINFPKRGIGEKSVSQLSNYCGELIDTILTIEHNENLSKSLVKKIVPFATVLTCLYKAKDELSVADLTKYLIRLIDLKEVFSEDTEENESRKMNITSLLGSMDAYVKQNEKAGIKVGLDEYLQTVSLYSDTDELDAGTPVVNVATVHSAKGLEFSHVFVVGLEEGVFPTSRSLDSEEEIEEERRVMYVAVTRAKKRLFLSSAQDRFRYGERNLTIPSRFLTEVGLAKKQTQQINDWRNREADYGQNRGYGAASKPTANITIPAPPVRKQEVVLSKYKIGMKVRHKKFGIGIVRGISGNSENCYGEIEFEAIGKLNLSLNYAPLEIEGE